MHKNAEIVCRGYATDSEMATALADLERRITVTQTGRINQVRIQSNKGV